MKINVKRFQVRLILMAMLAVCGGCGNGPEAERDAAAAPENESGSVVEETSSGSHDGMMTAEAAREDLSQRLGRSIDQIDILEARPVYWRSAALGCPDPDKSYAQALTRGWFIRLGVDGTEYRYHASESGEPFTCKPGWVEPPLDYAVE